MSIRYLIDELQRKRDAAGLGVLSLGICDLSGELVSSTPIPGSRCGHAGQNTADYGGYLLGEGMTREAAMYLGSLHNHFPALAEAASGTMADEYEQRISDLIGEKWGLEDKVMNLTADLDRLKARETLPWDYDQVVTEERERIIALLLTPIAEEIFHNWGSYSSPEPEGLLRGFLAPPLPVVLIPPAPAMEVDDEMPF
jgi:hypothetical protein